MGVLHCIGFENARKIFWIGRIWDSGCAFLLPHSQKCWDDELSWQTDDTKWAQKCLHPVCLQFYGCRHVSVQKISTVQYSCSMTLWCIVYTVHFDFFLALRFQTFVTAFNLQMWWDFWVYCSTDIVLAKYLYKQSFNLKGNGHLKFFGSRCKTFFLILPRALQGIALLITAFSQVALTLTWWE